MGDGARITTVRNRLIRDGVEFRHASGILSEGGDDPKELSREATRFEDLAADEQKGLNDPGEENDE